MKQPVTFRLDPDLLAAARRCAGIENRTLTNFVETLLKRHVMSFHSQSETLVSTLLKPNKVAPFDASP